ncbi:hypothetical protein [Thalassospira sp.]|uniref:hypothetical protein n=1 Tax=Thalassospira sp. TaxID=1912094 RepID=UPI003AA9801A
MKTKPIPFKPEMVQAIIGGRKTQTRRHLKLLGHKNITDFGPSTTKGYDWHFRDNAMRWHDIKHADLLKRCPYGQPGDMLWVREAWKACKQMDHIKPSMLGKHEPRLYLADDHLFEPACMMVTAGKYRPPMFMPRAYSRITLKITNIRVQRVQDTSPLDAVAEGITEQMTARTARNEGMAWGEVPDGTPDDAIYWLADYSATLPEDADRAMTLDPCESFKGLWQAVNGPESWNANPFVWAISFNAYGNNVDDAIRIMEAQAA